MRFLIDENISPLIGAALERAGYSVEAAASICQGAPDTHVIAVASAAKRILVSEDKDFGELAFRDGIQPPGIIRLALPGYNPLEKAERLLEVLATEEGRIVNALVVVEPSRIRHRPLPKL